MEFTGSQNDDILLVADHPGDVRLIEEAFGADSHEATLHVVSTGQDALDFVNDRGEYEDAPEPDVVLLDLHLPKVDGAEVLDAIKRDFPHIKVVVMTGQSNTAVAEKQYAIEPDNFMTKPTDPEGYLKVVSSLDDD